MRSRRPKSERRLGALRTRGQGGQGRDAAAAAALHRAGALGETEPRRCGSAARREHERDCGCAGRSEDHRFQGEVEALENTPISTDLVYGLINVRTDGERVLCGYMKEGSQDFALQLFRGGVEP
jgi:hypothetical protein